MSTHALEFQAEIEADPLAIYEAYARVSDWSLWDPDTRAAALEGPPLPGTRGWLRPRRGLRVRLQVLEARPGEVFTVACPVLGSRMVFEHRIEPLADRCRVRHRVRFEGWLAGWLLRRVGADLRAGQPRTLEGLARHLASGERLPR